MYGSRARKLLPSILLLSLLTLGGCATSGAKKDTTDQGFFPPPPDLPRIQFLMSITADSDLPGSRKGLVRLLLGDEPLRKLVRPRGVGVHEGVIYVADPAIGTVIKIDLQEGRFDWIRDGGSGKLSKPLGLAIAEDGTLFVADSGRRQVVSYAPGDHAFIRSYGDPKTLKPTDVAVFGNNVYVSDIGDHEIEVYDRESGERSGTLGSEGAEPGRFKFPSFVTTGPTGEVYVTDSMNFRVQRLSAEGEHIESYGSAGDWTGKLSRPKGIAVDEEGRVHVLDAGFENAQIFLPGGEAATFYGGYGNFLGHMYLPFGIALDRSALGYFESKVDPRIKAQYLIFVTNQSGPNRLNIYVFGEPVESAAGGK